MKMEMRTEYTGQIANEGITTQANNAYAGFWIRFLAVLIDGIALQAVFIVLNLILNVSLLNPPWQITMFQYVIQIIYFVALTVLLGQTLGKMVVGIKVIRQDKDLPNTWGSILLRETIGKFVSAITLLIGYIMAAFNKEKKALHDRIARTYVVKL
jgi:uncharacterized RDD family membrane protein YckC